MRMIQTIVFLVLLAAIAVFAVQNTSGVTVNFLRWNATVPVAFFIVVVYFLGMISGGTFVAILKRSYRGIVQPPKP
ncbi:MAG: hypothetical protein NVSMB14_12380 [Isosphaeraceae bacterium]